jgi:hypothetical protein
VVDAAARGELLAVRVGLLGGRDAQARVKMNVPKAERMQSRTSRSCSGMMPSVVIRGIVAGA